MKTNERQVGPTTPRLYRAGKRGRVLRSAEQRRELVAAYRSSGQTQAGFCRERGVHATTFNGWLREAATRGTQLVPVELTSPVEAVASALAAIEVLLPNGVRVGIRQQGGRDELIALVRGIAGYAGGPSC